MGKKDIKISLVEVLSAMYADYNKGEGEIKNLRHYEDEFGVPYGYLRKIEQVGIIVAKSASKRHRSYNWNEEVKMPTLRFEYLAQKVLNHSPSQQTIRRPEGTLPPLNSLEIDPGDSTSTSHNLPGKTLFSVDDVLEITFILQKNDVPDSSIPQIIKEIIKIKK